MDDSLFILIGFLSGLAFVFAVLFFSFTEAKHRSRIHEEFITEHKQTLKLHSSREPVYRHKRTHCISCGAPANPLKMTCEYCGTPFEQAPSIYPCWPAMTGSWGVSGIAFPSNTTGVY